MKNTQNTETRIPDEYLEEEGKKKERGRKKEVVKPAKGINLHYATAKFAEASEAVKRRLRRHT